MRALIVRQPWAGLIAAGLKTVEFRNRRTNLRERIAVYAGQAIPCSRCPIGNSMDLLTGEKQCCEPWRDMTSCVRDAGKVFCVATLADCRHVETADVTCPGCPDPAGAEWMKTWAWVLADLRALDPIPCKPPRGAQTWFHLPPEAAAEIERQIGGAE